MENGEVDGKIRGKNLGQEVEARKRKMEPGMRGAEGGKWEAEMLRTLAPRLLDLGLRGGSDLS